jgi:hypothetical protein
MSIAIQEWNAYAETASCVRVVIDNSVSIEGMKMKVLSGERQTLLACKVESHDSTFCFETTKPLYVELHTQDSKVSVRYVEKSGSSSYSTLPLGLNHN